MRYEAFVDEVQRRAGLRDRDEAERIVDATLETLGERLDPTETRDLADQLAAELKAPLFRRQFSQPFDLEEFYNRVHSRSRIGFPRVVELAPVVVQVLHDAISEGDWRRLCDELTIEYRPLLGGAVEGSSP